MNRKSPASKPSAPPGYKLRLHLATFVFGTSLLIAACGSGSSSSVTTTAPPTTVELTTTAVATSTSTTSTVPLSPEELSSSFKEFATSVKARLVVGVTTNACGSFGSLAQKDAVRIYQYSANEWTLHFESPTPIATTHATTMTNPLGDGEWFAQFSEDSNKIDSSGKGSIYGITEPDTCEWSAVDIFDGMDTSKSISDLRWTTPSKPFYAFAWAGPDGPHADGILKYLPDKQIFDFQVWP
ncbi:MAG: hypothetical protein WCL35_09445 [bacterium]